MRTGASLFFFKRVSMSVSPIVSNPKGPSLIPTTGFFVLRMVSLVLPFSFTSANTSTGNSSTGAASTGTASTGTASTGTNASTKTGANASPSVGRFVLLLIFNLDKIQTVLIYIYVILITII